MPFLLLQYLPEKVARVAFGTLCHLFRRSGCNDGSASLTAFRSQINDIVSGFDNIQIMLNDQHRVACIANPLQDVQQARHIIAVQSRCRLVQNIEGFAGTALCQFGCQFDSLRFTARQRGGGLSDLDIAESHIV